MSTLAPPATVDERTVRGQLARIHIRRYATHPLYLAGVALMVVSSSQMYEDGPKDWEAFTTPVVPAFFLGVLGVIIGYRLTSTEGRALSVLDAAPTDAMTRTLALCATAIVPALTATVWVVWRLLTWAAWPMRQELLDGIGGWVPAIAVVLAGSVVAAAGGTLFGIAAARWVRFPGAGLLAVIVLVLPCWVLAGGAVEPSIADNALVLAGASAMPYTLWTITDYVDDIGNFIGMRDGSPIGHLFYATTLCGLAIWAAVMKDAAGAERARWRRIGAALAVAAVASFLWAWLG
jgi:hypothetical protein